MAENARQEIDLPLGGKTYKVRPDFLTLCGIEAACDQPVRTLGMKCYATGVAASRRNGLPEISLTEMAAVVFVMVQGKPDAPKTATEVGEILVEDGYGPLLQPVGDFLTRAQRGNKEHEKEAAQAALAGPQKTGD